MAVTVYLLTLVGGASLLVMRQVDAALRQMHPLDMAGGGSLGFPLSGRAAVEELERAWAAYQQAAPDPPTVAAPDDLVMILVLLDLLFIVCYGRALVVLYNGALRLRLAAPPSLPSLPEALERLLSGGRFLVLGLVFVDLIENVVLGAAHLWHVPLAQQAGSAVTFLKLLLTVAVVAPLVIWAAAALVFWPRLRKTLASARAVLLVVGAVLAVVLVLPLGTEQIDDVVRAWGWWSGAAATAATVAAAGLVRGTVRQLTCIKPEELRPNSGEQDPQPPVLAVALLAAAAGAFMCWAGAGWGLLIVAMILFVIVLGGIGLGFGPLAPEEQESVDPELGKWLARSASGGLCAALVWVMARAAAFDVLVRAGAPRWDWMVLLAVFALVLTVAGTLFVWLPCGESTYGVLWKGTTAVTAALLWTTVLPGDLLSVRAPLLGGTVTVLMVGLASGAGTLALLVTAFRTKRIADGYRLPPALRLIGLSRFPAISLMVVWALLVAALDSGRFHDVRLSQQRGPDGAPPSLEQAYGEWLAAADAARPGKAHPLVLVAAQGGGIRAAVWTALVMECLFGPGPLSADDATCAQRGEFTAEQASRVVRADRLPVFLASGASGGSVGLAAWAARRVDLAERGPGWDRVPTKVDDILPRDYVAPDLARLLSADTAHLLLAQNSPDRAEILEKSFELSWGADVGRGLSRGLRASWQEANGARGDWRIPVLAFNSSEVVDGCRFVSSPVDFLVSAEAADGPPVNGDSDRPNDACGEAGGPAAGVLPHSTELIDFLCPGADVSLATAAHLSARFPYVSPTARVQAVDCGTDRPDRPGLAPVGTVTHLTDGGYFDNSGSATAAQAWRALEPIAAAQERASGGCVVPIFLQIDNGVDAGAAPGTDSTPWELMAPGQALFSQLAARQAMESGQARSAFAALRSPSGRPVRVGTETAGPSWFHVVPAPQPGLQPPLGWTLARETVEDMRRQLLSGENRTTIQKLARLLDPATTISCAAPERRQTR